MKIAKFGDSLLIITAEGKTVSVSRDDFSVATNIGRGAGASPMDVMLYDDTPTEPETPKAQEWTHPPAPSVKDYVRLTFRNGSTADGEVKGVNFYREHTWDEWFVALDGGEGGYIFSTKHRTDTYIIGDLTIVSVEHIEPPRELLWPKGTVVENNHTFALRRTAEDVYVGATEFRAELEAGLFRVRNYSKVVQP